MDCFSDQLMSIRSLLQCKERSPESNCSFPTMFLEDKSLFTILNNKHGNYSIHLNRGKFTWDKNNVYAVHLNRGTIPWVLEME